MQRDELKTLIKPRDESSAAVLRWLDASGIDSRDITNDGEWISFDAPVKRAEEMMGATFKTYQSTVRKHVKKVRSLSYSVPLDIRSHIDLIHPITRFGQLQPERNHILTQGAAISAAAINATCNTSITPDCLAELYKFGDYQIDPKANTYLGVNGFLEQYARYSDFEIFANTYAPKAKGSKFDYILVSGEHSPHQSTVCID